MTRSHTEYYSGDQIMNWVGISTYVGKGETFPGFLVGRPLERARLRWEDNIEMDHQKVGWGGMD